MRKPAGVALCALLLAPASKLSAQESIDSLLVEMDKRVVRVGLIYGQSRSQLDYDTRQIVNISIDPSMERRPAGQFGIYVRVPFGNHLAFEPELLVSHKGVRYKVENDPDLMDGLLLELRMAYAELPLLARYDFGRNERSRLPFIVAGPVFSLLGTCNVALDGEQMPLDSRVDCDSNADLAENPDLAFPFRRFDVGYVAGVGLPLQFMGLPLSVQFRYGQGVISAVRPGAADKSARNNNISILATAGF